MASQDEFEQGQFERIRNLALGGGLMGGIGGAIAGAASPKFKKLSDLLSPTAAGAGTFGGLAAGSGYVGDELIGPPAEEEANPYTWRTGAGGVASGATIGGTAGALAGSGALNKVIKSKLPDDNFIRSTVERLQKGGRLKAAGKLGALGAALGGLGLGVMAADEGMGIDVLMAEKEKRERERLGL